MAGLLPALDRDDSSLAAQPVAIGAGARALGMGGAFTAIADDSTATSWNPAGLTQCERPEAALSGSWASTRAEAESGRTWAETASELDHASVMFPFFAAGCMQTVGVAWMRQYDYARAVSRRTGTVIVAPGNPSDVTTDTQAVERERSGSLATLGVSWAVEPAPGWSLGVTVNRWDDRFTGASSYQESIHSTSSFQWSADPFLDSEESWSGTTRVEARSGTSFVLGALWLPSPAWSLGVTVKPAATVKFHRASRHVLILEYTGQGIPPDTTVVTRDAASELRLPPSATLGAAWRPDDDTAVSFDATWTRWSGFRVEDAAGTASPVSVLVDPEDFDDLWTFRLGCERAVPLDGAVIVPRCGVLAEWTPAITPAASSADLSGVAAGSDLWLGASVGAGLFLRRTTWDAAVQVRHAEDAGTGQFTGLDQTADLTVVTARLGVSIQF
jgi:long-subunit fatty acid transport protein